MQVFFVTGTDTGVGKTVLTGLLARYLQSSGVPVAALKPVSSGDRRDARALRQSLDGALDIDAINPWHFHAPLAPLLAARRERRRVKLHQALRHIRSLSARFEVILVEGAGGLLSPLGEDFNARDLIAGLRATPIVVCPNRLGAVNQALLAAAALPGDLSDPLPPSERVSGRFKGSMRELFRRNLSRQARIVLVNPRRETSASRTNPALLRELTNGEPVCVFPWLSNARQPHAAIRSPGVLRSIRQILGLAG
jgi:dethiobiotin synthetase